MFNETKTKAYIFSLISLLTMLTLNGCTSGEKNVSFTVLYAITAFFSLLLLIVLVLPMRIRDPWLITLFSCVFTVNLGYYLLSCSSSLEYALLSNRLAYFGSVFLPVSMLMIILGVKGIRQPKWLKPLIFTIGIAIFLIAASPGILDIYYSDVSFEKVNGAGTLIKEYGPLHPIYMIYLLGYFVSMITVIFIARKNSTNSNLTTFMLVSAVFVNICVWFAEQFVSISFEFLSISYVISELFLMGVYFMARENRRLEELAKSVDIINTFASVVASDSDESIPKTEHAVDREKYELYIKGVELLTPTERLIFDSHTARATTDEILSSLGISLNTLKFHNKHIYSKLGVHSRKELLDIYKEIVSSKKDE